MAAPPRGLGLVSAGESRGHLVPPPPGRGRPGPAPAEPPQGYIGPDRRWRRDSAAAGQRGHAARETGGGKAAADAAAT